MGKLTVYYAEKYAKQAKNLASVAEPELREAA
jgi:hypothetical protein